ncbi:hypothetical protein [Aureispira sp. CCB-E]|uniref:hypothetical protein n=1 Tax=Aureispira sp. CCB-E TaxID=3051121 RepID=UPI002868DDCF|nr:hypothetical protein [Aureispira sp. CCB-E]WMX17122.1 hypothetical protein QP953_12130 [Aureispira sp. CCB-E]
MKKLFFIFFLYFFTNTIFAQFDKTICEEILNKIDYKSKDKFFVCIKQDGNSDRSYYSGFTPSTLAFTFNEKYMVIKSNLEEKDSRTIYITYDKIKAILMEPAEFRDYDNMKTRYSNTTIYLKE